MATPPPLRFTQEFVQHVDNHFAIFEAEMRRLRQRLYALEAKEKLEELGRKPRFKIEFKSQMGEDVWIWDILGGQTEGFFIEVGAFDGYLLSVTYALEAVGWNGLLIEALPERAEQCRVRRPHSRVVHSALGRRGSQGTIPFINVHDAEGGTLSYVKPNISTSHHKSIQGSRLKTETIDVPITTMNELLKDHQGPIDVAMIDVEGAELDVLDGFDLDKHKPRLLILEDNSQGRDPALANYMKTKPYVFAGWLTINQLYIRADETKLIERAQARV